MLLAEASTMTTFLGTMTEVASWLFTQIGTIGTTIMETPFLYVPFGVFLVGAAIGLFGRILHKA